MLRSLTAAAMIFAVLCMVLAGPVCLGATPSFDGGIVINNGDTEYTEGGTWEAGKNREGGASYLSFIHNFPCPDKIFPQRHDICARAEGRTDLPK